MKYSQAVALVAVAYAGQAVAQDLSGLPQCAQTAALSGFASTGCAITDIACVCKSTSFISSVSEAIKTTCTAAEQAQTLSFAKTLCQSAGVTLPDTVGGGSSSAAESSAAQTSAAETSAAETSAAETSAAETTAAETTAAETSAPAQETSTPVTYTSVSVSVSSAVVVSTPAVGGGNGTVAPVPVPTVGGNGTAPAGSVQPTPTFQSGAIAQAASVLLSVAVAGFAVLAL